jgi:hypothetical protein
VKVQNKRASDRAHEGQQVNLRLDPADASLLTS